MPETLGKMDMSGKHSSGINKSEGSISTKYLSVNNTCHVMKKPKPAKSGAWRKVTGDVSVPAAAARIIAADFYAAPTDSLLPLKIQQRLPAAAASSKAALRQ